MSTIMKITIIALLLLFIALPAHGATDRELFMCSVGTIECEHVAKPLGKPLQVQKLEVATTTIVTVEDAKLIELRALIEQLRALIALLQAQQR